MLVLVDLLKLEVVVAPELGVASSHRVGSFQQIVTKETATGLDESGVLGLKLAGLVLLPDKAGELGHRRLGLKTVDVADLGDDASGVDLPIPGMEVSVFGTISNCCSIGFFELIDLLRIEHMDFPGILPQPSVLAECVDQTLPVDG